MKIKLGDIAKVQGGYAFKSSEFKESGTPVIRIGNLDGEVVNIDNKICYSDDFAIKQPEFLINNGDVLVAMSGATVGKIGVFNENIRALLNQRVGNIKPIGDIDKKVIYYCCKSSSFINYIQKEAFGCAQPNISSSKLEQFELNIPDKVKHKELITVLDATSRIISLKKNLLQQYDQLIKSRFVEMFGENGTEVPLTNYVWYQEGPGVRTVDFRNEGCILLTGSNINDNKITFGYKSDRFISNVLANSKYSHFICDKNDILVVTSAIAPDRFDCKVVVIDTDDKYCLNTGIIRFKPNKDHLTIGYFREFLKSNYFKNQVMSEMTGIAQMHFGPSHLRKMSILLPKDLKSQEEFDSFVQQVDKLKFEVIKLLNELRSNIYEYKSYYNKEVKP